MAAGKLNYGKVAAVTAGALVVVGGVGAALWVKGRKKAAAPNAGAQGAGLKPAPGTPQAAKPSLLERAATFVLGTGRHVAKGAVEGAQFGAGVGAPTGAATGALIGGLAGPGGAAVGGVAGSVAGASYFAAISTLAGAQVAGGRVAINLATHPSDVQALLG